MHRNTGLLLLLLIAALPTILFHYLLMPDKIKPYFIREQCSRGTFISLVSLDPYACHLYTLLKQIIRSVSSDCYNSVITEIKATQANSVVFRGA